jgi:trigger factor
VKKKRSDERNRTAIYGRNAKRNSARTLTVTDRAAKNGDIVDINFEGFVDDKAFEGGKAENFPSHDLGRSFIPRGLKTKSKVKNVGEEI